MKNTKIDTFKRKRKTKQRLLLKKGFVNREMSTFQVMTVDMLGKDPLDVWPPEISILQKMIVLWL